MEINYVFPMTLFNVKGVFSLPLVQVDQVDDILQSQPYKKNARPNNIFDWRNKWKTKCYRWAMTDLQFIQNLINQ